MTFSLHEKKKKTNKKITSASFKSVFHQSCIILRIRKIESQQSRALGNKTFFMLNSVEHEILIAHKYKKYQEIQLFQALVSENASFPAHKC